MSEFTIVIASAVRDSLPKLLESINSSTVLPSKVILSIPSGKKYSLEGIYRFNIQIISESKGQVAQRNSGFKNVKTPLCIQMDDDFVFDMFFLEEFLKSFLKLPFNSALAPAHYYNNKFTSMLVRPKPPFSKLM